MCPARGSLDLRLRTGSTNRVIAWSGIISGWTTFPRDEGGTGTIGSMALVVDNPRKRFGSVAARDRVSFRVEPVG